MGEERWKGYWQPLNAPRKSALKFSVGRGRGKDGTERERAQKFEKEGSLLHRVVREKRDREKKNNNLR